MDHLSQDLNRPIGLRVDINHNELQAVETNEGSSELMHLGDSFDS